MKKLLVISLLVFGFSLHSNAQRDPEVVNYIHHLPLLNGAAIAQHSDMNFALVNRFQWVGFEGAPSFRLFEFNMPINNTPSYVGAMIWNGQIGIDNNTRINVNYTYKAPFADDGFIAFSIAPEINIWSEKQSQIRTDFPDDPLYTYTDQNYYLPNARFGAFSQYKKFFFGISTPALLKNSFDAGSNTARATADLTDVQWSLFAQTDILLNKGFEFHPSIVTRVAGGAPIQVHLNGYFKYRRQYGFGLSFHSLYNLNLLFDYHYRQSMKFAYSWTYNYAPLGAQSPAGSHELLFVYGIKNKARHTFNLQRLLNRHLKKKERVRARVLKKKARRKASKGRRQPYQ